jgi:hypothetical protein
MGLKDDLRQVVEMHLPDSVSQAATLVAVQEHLCDRFKSQQRKPTFTKTDTKALPAALIYGKKGIWKNIEELIIFALNVGTNILLHTSVPIVKLLCT